MNADEVINDDRNTFYIRIQKKTSIKNEKRMENEKREVKKWYENVCQHVRRPHKTETFQLLPVNQVNMLIVLKGEFFSVFFFFCKIFRSVRWLYSSMRCVCVCVFLFHIPVAKFPYSYMDLDLNGFNRNQWTEHETHI